MAVPAPTADNQPLGVPTMSTPASLNLSLSAMLSMIPGSRFLGRLRKGGTGFESLDVSEPSTTAIETLATEASVLVTEVVEQMRGAPTPQVQQQQIPSFPGPWEFLTSGYIVGLVIMAVLLHRMQNIVIPPPRRTRRPDLFHRPTLWERIHDMILPLDLSRTTTRLILHIPSVYFLSKMLLIWIFLAFQTCEVPLTFFDKGDTSWGSLLSRIVEALAKWSMKKEMAQICWSTFCAVCGAFLVEGFIKSLDGVGRNGFPLGGVNSLSPFHLISYAFLLHIYSSPLAHGFRPVDDSPSRPDKHVVITITIALLQLSMFHILSVSKRLTSHRLIPTTLTSFLSLVHFHTTLYYYFMGPRTPTVTIIPMGKPTRRTYITINASYPLLNYVPNLFESVLLFTIFLTTFINAVGQLLVRGRIEHLFSGLAVSTFRNDDEPHTGFFANLPYEEDFIIVLLRLGVASLEATGLRGWHNEVAPIQRPRVKPHRGAGEQQTGLAFAVEDTYGRVRMGRASVAQIEYGSTRITRTPTGQIADVCSYDDIMSARRGPRRSTPGPIRLRRGFSNDIRTIDLGMSDGSFFGGRWIRNIIACWQFLVVLWGVLVGLVSILIDKARTRTRHLDAGVGDKARLGDEDTRSVKQANCRRSENEMYQKFLRGEEISDDDEDEGSIPLSDEDETSDESDEGDAYEEREAEAIGLFTDILRHGGNSGRASSSSTAVGEPSTREMVLAHLLHGSDSLSHPLTRRRWKALVQRDQLEGPPGRPPYLTEWNNDMTGGLIQGSTILYSDAKKRDKEQGLQHVCVVCMLEKREIICWPCRCMAICDGCREALATRASASKHRCPCCRQIVEGYSKIFIP